MIVFACGMKKRCYVRGDTILRQNGVSIEGGR